MNFQAKVCENQAHHYNTSQQAPLLFLASILASLDVYVSETLNGNESKEKQIFQRITEIPFFLPRCYVCFLQLN